MKTFLVVTLSCPDKPGIVENLTDVIVAHGGNWEESRFARLGGEFAGIVMVSVLPDGLDKLTTALNSLANNETNVSVRPTSPKTPAGEGHLLCVLRLEGADHEGIVHNIAEYLAKQGVNVNEMATQIELAPMTASPLFHMDAQLDVPPNVTIDELRENLKVIGDQLGVDIEVAEK